KVSPMRSSPKACTPDAMPSPRRTSFPSLIMTPFPETIAAYAKCFESSLKLNAIQNDGVLSTKLCQIGQVLTIGAEELVVRFIVLFASHAITENPPFPCVARPVRNMPAVLAGGDPSFAPNPLLWTRTQRKLLHLKFYLAQHAGFQI